MSDNPPQLGNIPQVSDLQLPTLESINQDQSQKSIQDKIASTTQSAMDAVQNHPVTQNIKATVTSGPVAENVKDQHAKTTAEFRKLADSRTVPEETAATGQPLTHYHSFFYNLLSWQNPRATALSFISIVLFIFGTRYLPILRWSFKILAYSLGLTASAEVAGRVVLKQGLASSFRPKKYYTIPKESLEASLEDVEQLINFFIIEFQRILFAENLANTVAAFVAAFLGYWLIKWLPLWGLSLIAVSSLYLGPLIYANNKEVIDEQLTNVSQIINQQATQVQDLAAHHTARATETVKAYTADYSAKAQSYIGGTGSRATSPEAQVKKEPGSTSAYASSDFPATPKVDPVSTTGPISGETNARAEPAL